MMRQEYSTNTWRSDFSTASSFQDIRLLRGTVLWHVMRSRGRILTNNVARAESYFLSRQVAELDWFISHNWSVKRGDKFVCLVLHFNLPWAMLFTFVFTCVTAILLNVVPSIGHYMLPALRGLSGEPFAPHVLCVVFGNICFLVVLFFWHEFPALFPGGLGGPRVFLDKTCIHQTDPEIMGEGVRKLAAFLMSSKNFFAIFTDEYLQKAWTVYELASFLLLHKDRPLVLMNVQTAKMVIAGSQCFFLFVLFFRIAILFGDFLLFKFAAAIILGGLFSVYAVKNIRKAFTVQASLLERIKGFTLVAAKCTVESDREIIYRNIRAFMVESGHSTLGQSQEHVLRAFDRLIQTKLVRHVEVAKIRYTHVLVIFISQMLFGMDCVGTGKYPWILPRLLDGAIHLVLWLAIYPNSFWLACALLRQRTDLQGCCEKLLIFASICVFLCWSVSSWLVLFHFQLQSSEGHSWATGAFVCWTMAQFVLTFAFYRPAVQLAAGSGASAAVAFDADQPQPPQPAVLGIDECSEIISIFSI